MSVLIETRNAPDAEQLSSSIDIHDIIFTNLISEKQICSLEILHIAIHRQNLQE